MDRDPNVVQVRSSFERPREPVILAAAIVAFLALAILKPWSLGAPRAGARTASPGTTPAETGHLGVAPSPSPAAHPDPNAMSCLSGDTEQVVLLERWSGNEVASWIATTDRAVTGPLDPTISTSVVFSSHIVGLGVCAPTALGGSVAAAARVEDIQLLIQGGRGMAVEDLGAPTPITLVRGAPDAAFLYAAPAAALLPSPAGQAGPASPAANRLLAPSAAPALGPGPTTTWWPAGSYAIEFMFPADPTARVRWLRVDILGPAAPD